MAAKAKTAKAKTELSKSDDKKAALTTAIEQIEKQYGKGSIMRLGENRALDLETISTGSISLDAATGVGGFPRGRIVEVYGPESSGKTTLALQAVAAAQKAEGVAAFIDAEHALDPEYATKLGVNIDELLVSQPDDGEQAVEIAEALARSGAISIIVIDSVAALVPKSEIEGNMVEASVGTHARLMSKACRKLAGVISKSNTLVIFINQLRQKIGVIYGNPEVTTGGIALKFYATIRVDVRKGEPLKDSKGVQIGSRTRCKIVKNKVAPPFKTAEFDILYGEGISKESELVDMGVKYEILEKSGSWFSYNGERLGQGREKVRDLLKSNKTLSNEIEEKLRVKLIEGSGSFSEDEITKIDEADDPVSYKPVENSAVAKASIDAFMDE